PQGDSQAVDWELESRLQQLVMRVDQLDSALEESKTRTETLSTDQENLVKQFTESLQQLKTEIDILRARETQNQNQNLAQGPRAPLDMEGLLSHLINQPASSTPSSPASPPSSQPSVEPSRVF